jgi:hypothetical protein
MIYRDFQNSMGDQLKNKTPPAERFHHLTLPGPHNARPGFAFVCSPSLST